MTSPATTATGICRRCAAAIARLRPSRTVLPGGVELISAGPYEGVARKLVTRMKFAKRLALAEIAAERMVRAWGATRHGLLVPVPPAPARRRARGYDVAQVLVDLVAGEAAATRVATLLAREDGPRQVGRPRRRRLAEPPRIRLRVAPPPERAEVWLVDDVATTGATLAACAVALRGAGATRVRALTFARSLGPSRRQA